jgi:frataxin-like iron-binding protein CyaY
MINEDLAKRNHDNYSMSDYKAGSATSEYNSMVADAAEKIEAAKNRVSDEGKIKLDNLLSWYKSAMANWINKHNANGYSHVSWMISGRGNYNMNKHNRYVAKEDKLWQEYNDIMAIESKIDKIIDSNKIIRTDDKDALEKLKEKLAEEQKAHDEMINYNKQARKEKKEVYPTYMLTNSNQRIKNIKDRISQLEKLEELKETQGNVEIEINGIKIVDNLEANRVQMIFPDKPEESIRKILKSNGFRYSYTNNAWQRNRSKLSVDKAKNIAESLKENNVAV